MREGLVLIGLPVGDLPATLSVSSRLSTGTMGVVQDARLFCVEITILFLIAVPAAN